MNKELDISKPASQRLAEVALFDRLQSYFNLHPGELVKEIRNVAKLRREEPIRIAKDYRGWVREEFKDVIGEALSMTIVNQPYESENKSEIPYSEEIRKYFNFVPEKIAEDVISKCNAEGLDAIESVRSIQQLTPGIINWAFDVIIEILKRDKK